MTSKNTQQMTPSWQLIRPSVELVRKNSEAVLIIVLLPALLLAFGSLFSASHYMAGLIILVIGLLWRLINLPVSCYLQAAAASGKSPSIEECYRSGLPRWPQVVGFEILYFIMTIIGLILLIVPGLIVLRRYYLAPFYIAKDGLSIKEAMKRSEQQSKPVSGYVWGTIGVLVAIAIIAAIFSEIKYIGPILAAFISLIYLFGAALRWHEIKRVAGKK